MYMHEWMVPLVCTLAVSNGIDMCTTHLVPRAYVCMCVCVCVCVRVYMCVCVCVHVFMNPRVLQRVLIEAAK